MEYLESWSCPHAGFVHHWTRTCAGCKPYSRLFWSYSLFRYIFLHREMHKYGPLFGQQEHCRVLSIIAKLKYRFIEGLLLSR